jgi:hypothetical protein
MHLNLNKVGARDIHELRRGKMPDNKNGKLTGAFRFGTDWHINEGPTWGVGTEGAPFDGFERCNKCGGNVRYCGLNRFRGFPNMSVSPAELRRNWEGERQLFADISGRCTCDPEGDKPYALEYDRRPFSMSYDGSAAVPDTKKIVTGYLENSINRVIEGLERLRKRIR